MTDRIPYELPHFPDPNYVDPVTRGHGLIVFASVVAFLATAAVGLRLLSKISTKNLGPSDACILLAWVSAVERLV